MSLTVQVLSFLSSVALASYLGASYETDAYYLALSIPLLVYGIVVGGIRVGAIPALNDENMRQDNATFSEACSELVTAVFLAALVVSGTAIAISVLTLPLLSGHADERTFTLARTLVFELSPLTVTGALAGAFGAILTVRGRYVAPIAVTGLEPITKILLLVAFAATLGAHALVLGNVIGSAMAMAILWVLLLRQGTRIAFRFPHRSAFLRTVLAVSGPLLLGQIILQANPVVDRLMASSLATGSITILELGYRMFGVSTVLLVSTLIAPVTATWATRYAAEGWPILRESAFRAMRLGLLVLPPIVALSIVLKGPIVTVLYRGGEYSAHDVALTANVFAFYMLALPAQVLTGVVSAVFVVRKNTVTPMWIASANVGLNVVFDLVLRAWLGVAGIALSTTVTYTILWIAFLLALRRHYGGLGLGRLIPPGLRVAAATLCATGIAVGTSYLLGVPGERYAALGVVALVGSLGMATYVGVLWLNGEGAALSDLTSRLLRSTDESEEQILADERVTAAVRPEEPESSL